MQFRPPAPNNRHQIRVFQQSKMFRHRLPRHIQSNAKFAERLPVVRLQPVQQFPTCRVRQRFKNFVHKKLYATIWLHVKKQLYALEDDSAFTPSARLSYNVGWYSELRGLPIRYV